MLDVEPKLLVLELELIVVLGALCTVDVGPSEVVELLLLVTIGRALLLGTLLLLLLVTTGPRVEEVELVLLDESALALPRLIFGLGVDATLLALLLDR